MLNENSQQQTSETKDVHVHVSTVGGGALSKIQAINSLIIMTVMLAVAVIVAILVFHFARNSERARATHYLGQRQAIVTETIVTGFREAANLITMNVDLQHSVEIVERGGFLWLGTREQTFAFHGNGLFTTDLSVFSGDNVILDNYRSRVWVAVQRPIFYGVIIDWEKTEIDGVRTSFLGWGEINLSPEEFNELMLQATNGMELKALQELTAQSYVYTERAIRTLILSTLEAAGISGYDIQIKWN